MQSTPRTLYPVGYSSVWDSVHEPPRPPAGQP